jgi:hypothetical protein
VSAAAAHLDTPEAHEAVVCAFDSSPLLDDLANTSTELSRAARALSRLTLPPSSYLLPLKSRYSGREETRKKLKSIVLIYRENPQFIYLENLKIPQRFRRGSAEMMVSGIPITI